MARSTYTSLAVPWPGEPPPPKRQYRYALVIAFLIITNFIVYYRLFHTKSDGNAIFINLSKVVNNRGFGETGANFDGLGHHFICPELTQPSSSSLYIGNVAFRPVSGENNDATARGQVITLPKKRLGALYLLVSVNHGPVTRTHLAVTYKDGSISSTIIDVPDWQDNQINNIRRLDHIPCQTNIDGVTGALFLVPLFVDPAKTVSHLTLPYTYPIGSFAPALHTFAITAYPTSTFTSEAVRIVSALPTLQWLQQAGSEYQWIRVRIHNTSPYCLPNVKVHIQTPKDTEKKSGTVRTIQHGFIERLASGQIAVVKVAVDRQMASGTVPSLVTVSSKSWFRVQSTITEELMDIQYTDMTNYTEDEKSLQHHQPPYWLREAKFGIFIHWGVYTVPSWSKVGQSYSEWYWWQLMQQGSPTFEHHKNTYGQHFEYDDFIDLWNTSAFDPYQWLDLVDKSHAKYFVFTTKHHDGIALFDTKVSRRSSVHFKPRRDFVRELIDVAKSSYPQLKSGLYFSLPEWYHPKYRDEWLGWHGPPRNAYNQSIVPYTGSPPIDDFVNELQVPQFLELIDQYEPDLLWCDIGGINNSSAWQAKYFNKARAQGKQVAINDRCGNGISDFQTIEYQDVANTPSRFWEATRGIDPYSFGYNHETRPDQYASTTSLIHELINVVARGGNFLLNIGPDAQGNIPPVMRQRLIEIGEWLDQVGPSIFEVAEDPYWVTVQDTATPSQTILFTNHRLGSSFYIFCLEKPLSGRVILKTPIPLHSRAIIRLMGDPIHEKLEWRVWDNGRLIIEVPNRVIEATKHAWVFELKLP